MIRRAFVCQKCRTRVLLTEGDDPWDYVPSCGPHGPMVRQVNQPYRGKSTEPPEHLGVPPAVDDQWEALRGFRR